MNKKLQFKSLILLVALLLGGAGSAWGDTTVLTLDCAKASSSSDKIGTAAALQTFLNTAADVTNKITVSSNPTGDVYGAKGSGGNGIPDKCLKVGKASGSGGFSFTIDNSYSEINRVVITGYGWKKSSTIAVNGSGTQSPTAAATETVFTFDLTKDTRDISIAVTTSAVCITKIELIKTSDTRTPTTLTIGNNDTEGVYKDETAKTPTATVKAGDTTIEGATVKWGSDNSDVATIDENTGAITLVGAGTTTIKAEYLGATGYKPSNASYILTVYGNYTSLAQIHSAVTTTETNVKYTFANEYITFISGDKKNVYISDGINGMNIYNSNQFTSDKIVVGAKLSGSIKTKFKDFSGTVEFTTISNDNLAGLISGSSTVSSTEKNIDEIAKANQGMLITIKGVTFDDDAFIDGEDSILYSKKFNSQDLTKSANYDITGIIIFNSNKMYIAPRSAEDIVLLSTKTEPTSTWYTDSGKGTALTATDINLADGNVSFFFDTNSTGTISYESSDESVATIANNGTITPINYGTTTITAKTAGNTDFLPSETTFTLTVKDEGVDYLSYNNVGISGTSYKDWNGKSFGSDAIYKGNSAGGNNSIQLRSSNGSGIVTTATGGRAKKITIVWNSNTPSLKTTSDQERRVDIYAKNTPYESPSDLYGNNNTSTKVGSLLYDGETSTDYLDIPGNYAYIGIRSNNGALYLDNIVVEWTNDVEVEFGESQMTTFSFDSTVDFTDSDIQAYTAKTDVSKGIVNLTPVDGNIVPSNTGVILIANGTNLTGSIIQSDLTDLGENEMIAANEDTAVVYNVEGKYNYILQNGKFYKATGKKLKSGKAFLSTTYNVAATGARELQIVFEGEEEATGIADIRSQKEEGGFFNLSGQRVTKPTKGLYIINGKKMIVK